MVFYAEGTPLARFGGLESRPAALTSDLEYNGDFARGLLETGRFVRAPAATPLAAEYFKNFHDNAVEVSLEVYQKQLENLVEYRNGATLLLN